VPLPAYVIVSPVRDEAEHLQRTIDSVADQRHRPRRWIIVDDGSSDATAQIAARAAEAHDWIEVVTRPARTSSPRARGAPIVAAFNVGLERITVAYDFVVKLDGDLYLPPHYFEWIAQVYERVPRAGIVGGVMPIFDGREWVPDKIARHTVGGPAKAYRRECFEEIGGLQPSMGWDGIDEFSARARGWTVHVLTELEVLHFRPRGTRQDWWRARWEEGRGSAFMGYLPSWVIVRAGYRALVERPPVVGGIVLYAGWLWARLRRLPQVPDEPARAELRKEQRLRLRSLLRGGGGGAEPAVLPGGGPAFWYGETARDTPAAAPPSPGP
jgi:poly-beta-1,6-N-acetyl-D-glucosamine synthase